MGSVGSWDSSIRVDTRCHGSSTAALTRIHVRRLPGSQLLTVVRWGYWLLASVIGLLWPATILSWLWGGVSAVLFDYGARTPFMPSWIEVVVVCCGAFGVARSLGQKR
jgi:hypothetical protein